MRFCEYCGKEVPRTAYFCRYCGKEITQHDKVLNVHTSNSSEAENKYMDKWNICHRENMQSIIKKVTCPNCGGAGKIIINRTTGRLRWYAWKLIFVVVIVLIIGSMYTSITSVFDFGIKIFNVIFGIIFLYLFGIMLLAKHRSYKKQMTCSNCKGEGVIEIMG